jgi:hypothetical protein
MTRVPKNKTDLKYFLYERSVQCPDWHVRHFPRYYRWMTGREAKLLREDFCGTARISCEWVRSGKDRRAVGLDLDPEPLDYYARMNRPLLAPDEAKRVRLLRKDVCVATTEKFDLIAACNFSFFIFHEREALIRYFKAARSSLKKGGAIFLEMAGGEGMQEAVVEPRTFTVKGYGRVRYVWEQGEYDPIRGLNDYAIHFRLPNGRWMRNVFRYHWRLWGIPEIREALAEAGFSKSHVIWETTDRDGEGTGEYAPMESGDHAHAWIAYVAAVR